jgi:hypothetical protein
MANVDFTTDQIVDLVLRLPSDQKKEVLIALASESPQRRDERMALGEAQMRRLGAARGLDWERMSEDEREALADQLIHEDRPTLGE